LKKVLSYAVAAFVVGAAIFLYHPLPENPSSQTLANLSKGFAAEIVRDKWGVPHISGVRDADASFGLAYAHAQDDFETIQETVAATRGVMAHYRGSSAAPTDYLVGLLDVWGTIERDYKERVPAPVKEIAEAYAAGMNLYASRHPELLWPGLAPFIAEDVIAGFVFKTPFFYGLDKTLLALFENEHGSELALEPSSKGHAWRIRKHSGAELGSNAIAVSAKRSGDGTTRLLINSHQPMIGPVAWYEAHIKSDQGLDIMGGVFPGTPLILHGFNRHLGWANTVNKPDLADTYLLTINPDNEQQYRLDEQWLDFSNQDVVIMVKLFGPFAFKATRTVLRSKHGPVIPSGDDMFALRYAGMGEIRQLEQYYRLNRSSDKASFFAALKINALPSINYIYADKDSNIAFIHNAQYPNRDDRWNWKKDLPGDRSALIWDGYRDFSQVPQLMNPSSGLVFNANNTPYSATDGPDNLKADNFPQSMGLSTKQTNRALRLIELNDGKSKIGRSELLALKFDDSYSVNSDAHKIMQRIAAMNWSNSPDLQKAVAHLDAWDLATNKENRHAALPGLIINYLIQEGDPKGESSESLEAAFGHAVEHLLNKFGRLDVLWGEVNRLKRGKLDLAVDGGPDVLRAIYSLGLEDGETHATHGDTWMALIEWDSQGHINADVLHQFGSATLDENSKHYADQAPLFVGKAWRKANFDIDAVRLEADSILRIGGPQ
jgi:acyl-homoserine-lactone acylase